MSLAILFHFLCTQHVSDINVSIIRSLQLCCWITTLVVLFCKDRGFSISINLWCLVVCVWCDVLCRFVVVGRRIFIDIDHYLLFFVIIVLLCVVCFIGWLVIWCIVNVLCYVNLRLHIPRFVVCWRSQIHITKYINSAPNYLSTNKTYYTQENTVITKHKR